VELNYYLSFLFKLTAPGDIINPCSSGSTYESAMRILVPKDNQLIVTSHALASMGFGLTGGIGLSLAHPEKRTIILEGDGGFAQNFQELSTVKANHLNTKIFIMDNGGYGSIRRNQARAFEGRFIGCDFDTGLQLPDWVAIGNSYGIKTLRIDKDNYQSQEYQI
jgi:acetolactate synthase-1/2/3 large subunit